MKKITILAAVVALLGSCAQNTEDTINPNTKVEGRTIYATFDNEEEETKTYVESYKYLRWHAGDEISFFDATTHNNQYAFAGNNGDAEGEFNAVATGEGTAITTTYGVYPYNAKTSISEEGVISVELPAIQAYGVNSFGKGANTMVAVGESATDDKLFFKNACGYLVVKLYNESGATVKSVVLEGNNEEKITGAATIAATHAGIPSVTMADTATTSVTIDCGEGVAIGTTAETATEFWFALPEITFEHGITITATSTDGVFEKTTTKPVVITRNNVQPMKALCCKFVIPETWKIYYTATEKVTPYNSNVFGAKIVSNEWNETTEKGVIIFNDVITTIGRNAFAYCNSLTSITIPLNVTSIAVGAFQYCSLLKNISIPKGVTQIGGAAFSRCYDLANVIIPEGVISIGNEAFYNCSNLTKIEIPNSVTSIGNDVFRGSGLTDINIPNNVVSIGERAFSGCQNLLSATIGNGLTELSLYTFSDCPNLKDVILCEKIELIGYAAFGHCYKLTSITIPNSVTQIAYGAFGGCSSLASIYCKPTIPPIGDSTMFTNNASNLKIYVPRKSVNAYKTADGWKDYADAIVGYNF